MRTTSPDSSEKSPTLPGTGDGSMVRPSRMTVKRLPAPPDPPATPNGGMMFLSPSTERLATSPRMRTSRRSPSPPRNSPSPQEPSRRPCDSIRNGHCASTTSADCTALKSPSGNARTAWLPSVRPVAPVPAEGYS